MMTHNFNAQQELLNIRQRKGIAHRKTYPRSRLQKWRAELVALRKAGASYPELALWLRQQKRIKVTHTTVLRYLSQLPELQETPHAELS